MDLSGHDRRRAVVVFTDDDKHRAFNFLQSVRDVNPGYGLAAANVTRYGRTADVAADAQHDVLMRIAVGLGKPACQRAVHYRFHAFFLRDPYSFVPPSGRIRMATAGGVREHHAKKRARILQRDGFANHPAQRQSHPMTLFNAERRV